MNSLASSLFLKEKMKTTEAKAKELAPFAEKFISRADNTLSSKRYFASFFHPTVVKKLTETIGPRYKERRGGYTRIIKLGPRLSDGAKMAIIELVS